MRLIYEFTLLFVAGLLVGFLSGVKVVDAEWQNDCYKLGAHRSPEGVFTCKWKPE